MTYEQQCHNLDTAMLQASNLTTEQEQQDFVATQFQAIYKAYTEHQVDYENYRRLVNRLAAYANGAYNDYLDLLTGAATMGMLDIFIARSKQENLAKQARARSQDITDMTGRPPISPEFEEPS